MADFLFAGLIGTSLACFLAYWGLWAAGENTSLTGGLIKSGATASLALLALLDGANGRLFLPLTSFLGLMALGLGFGALGDFALARRGERAFLLGMAAFAIGHLLYATALWQRSQNLIAMDLSQNDGMAFSGGVVTTSQLAALALLAALLASTEIWLAPRTGALRWPVRGYVLVIGAMAAVAILLVPNGGRALLQLGAALFVLSDIMLALRLFVVTRPRVKTLLSLGLWPAYWLGQALLLVGAIAYSIGLKG